MERAIEFITSFLSQCSECKWGQQGNCEFLLLNNRIPSPENNPYMEDDIMTLTNEQRAFRIAHMRGNPCEEQMVFEQYLRKLEEHLEKAIVPSLSTDVLRLIGKIYRLNSLVKRGSDAYYVAFNDIADASIDKCLGRIDYYYLELGVDIESAIKSVSKNYSRKEALDGMYPMQFVESYIRKAFKLEIGDLTSGDRLITQIVEDIKEQKAEFEEFERYNSSAYRNLGYSAIKELRWIFDQEANKLLIERILYEFGYSSVVENQEVKDLTIDGIILTHPDDHYAVFERWDELQTEINDSLTRNFTDPIQYTTYLQDIIVSAKEISKYYYPKDADENKMEAAALLHFLSYLKVPSYKPLIEVWREARKYAYERYQNEDITFEKYLDILRRAATDKATEEGKQHQNNEFTILNALRVNMNMLAVYIAGCLLKNFSRTTVEDLQESCNVQIATKVDDFDLVLLLNFSQGDIDHYRESINKIAQRKAAKESQEIMGEPQEDTLLPTEMDEIIRKCVSLYKVNGDTLIFNTKIIKHYAIFLKELYRVVYRIKEEHFSMQWRKVPIYPMADGSIPTHKQLSNGMRNYDSNKDIAIMEKYRTALTNALSLIQ